DGATLSRDPSPACGGGWGGDSTPGAPLMEMSPQRQHPLPDPPPQTGEGTKVHDGTDAEARPVFAEERRILGLVASSWPGIIAPVVIGILALTAWELTVRIKGIPHYILPGPILIAQTLWNDWATLSESLLI